jgi:hypothetical protein
VNLKISDNQLQRACREMLTRDAAISGRALRAQLLQRFGSAGKKDRVYAVWRALRAEFEAPAGSPDMIVLQGALQAAQQKIVDLEAALINADHRAAIAEERERIHQDRWANEIHQLREQVRRLGAEVNNKKHSRGVWNSEDQLGIIRDP